MEEHPVASVSLLANDTTEDVMEQFSFLPCRTANEDFLNPETTQDRSSRDETSIYDDPSLDDVISLVDEDIYIESTSQRTSKKLLGTGIPPLTIQNTPTNHGDTTDAPFDEGNYGSALSVEKGQEEKGASASSPHIATSESDVPYLISDEEIGGKDGLCYILTAASTQSIDQDSTNIEKAGNNSRFTRRLLFISVSIFLLFIVVVTFFAVIWSKRRSNESVEMIAVKPCTSDCPFTTTAELYRAVDWYLFHETTMNTTEVANTTLSFKYGYPINRWNVSLLHDFSEVFRVGARKSGPVLTPDTKVIIERRVLEEDISDWDVSNAKRMDFMVRSASCVVC